MGFVGRRGYVYFVQGEPNGLIKIGTTGEHPDVRLASLRKGSPVPLRPLGFTGGSTKVERALHIRFKHIRSHGEWFRPEQDLLDFIADYARPWPAHPKAFVKIPKDDWAPWIVPIEMEMEHRAVMKWQIRNYGRVLWSIDDMLQRAFPKVPNFRWRWSWLAPEGGFKSFARRRSSP